MNLDIAVAGWPEMALTLLGTEKNAARGWGARHTDRQPDGVKPAHVLRAMALGQSPLKRYLDGKCQRLLLGQTAVRLRSLVFAKSLLKLLLNLEML